MKRNNCKKNVVLIGFMGAGKSSAGRLAAEMAGLSFVETDEEIERLAGEKIESIFQEQGEDYFRQLENSVCESLRHKENAVISTGGGILKRSENAVCLKESGFVIYLSADLRHIFKNLENDATRPVLAGVGGEKKLLLIERILKEREPDYKACADNVIDVTDKSIEEIAREILIMYRGN